ncbi:TPA: hypothetical protein N0F65_004652 [Lagenidium giganteum]|uniref:Uncharacterized protein n=1 Tax=Lagenidium giganteum TaxID=4803 RepID=A0AAV2ZBR0_9STRA|nr:TPA: hypothetical protein N0F65_004652 [Lagenidium giganteum]
MKHAQIMKELHLQLIRLTEQDLASAAFVSVQFPALPAPRPPTVHVAVQVDKWQAVNGSKKRRHRAKYAAC